MDNPRNDRSLVPKPTMTEAEETENLPEPLYAGLTPKQLRTVNWLCTPEPLREPKTQKELAAELGVGSDTVSRWTRTPKIVDAVQTTRHALLRGRDVTDVLGAMVTLAAKGYDVPAAKLVLEVAGMLGSTEQQGTTTVQIAFVQQNAAPNPLRRQSDASPDALRGGAYDGDEAPAEGVGGSDREPTK